MAKRPGPADKGDIMVRLERKLAVGAAVIVLALLWTLGFAGAPPALRARAATVAMSEHQESSATTASSVPTPKGEPAFDATFKGSKLSTKLWDTCYPKMASYNGGCQNWGNTQEAEWYLPSQVKVSRGRVALVAKRTQTVGATSTGAQKIYECRSGMITSYPGWKFKYGFVQVVAKIPHGKGLWPALWLAPTNGKYPPEIDMVESWGVKVSAGSFFHPDKGHHPTRSRYSPALTDGWQTYSLSWTRNKITIWVGKRKVLTVSKNIPRQEMYFIADLAEYLPAKSGYCGGEMLIKSVKVWKS